MDLHKFAMRGVAAQRAVDELTINNPLALPAPLRAPWRYDAGSLAITAEDERTVVFVSAGRSPSPSVTRRTPGGGAQTPDLPDRIGLLAAAAPAMRDALVLLARARKSLGDEAAAERAADAVLASIGVVP